MKNVKTVKGRDGKVRLYLEKKGYRRVRLASPLPEVFEGSDLAREVEALIQRPAPTQPATLHTAIQAYERDAAAFARLAPSTRYEYGLILRELEQDFGDLPLTMFTAAPILKIRDAWAERGHRAANVRLVVLRNILRPALIEGQLGGVDPFSLVAPVKRPGAAPEPHRLWPEATLAAVIAQAIAEQRHGLARALAIARYTGARRGDLVRLRSTTRAWGRISFVSGKRGILVDIEEDPRLTAWLDQIADRPPASAFGLRRRSKPAANLVFTKTGDAYSEDGLGQALAELIGRMARQRLVDSDRYDLHGLRHTRGVELALAGCTDAEGAVMMGHSSPSTFHQYRRQADRMRLERNASAKLALHRTRAAAPGESDGRAA